MRLSTISARRKPNSGQGVRENLAQEPKGGDTDQLKAVAAGQCDVTISNQYYYARLARSQKPDEKQVAEKIAIVFPNQNSWGTHVNISGAGVLKNAPHRENAVKFLEYLASDEAQRYFADGNNEWPVVRGVKVDNPVLNALGDFKARPPERGCAREEPAELAENLRPRGLEVTLRDVDQRQQPRRHDRERRGGGFGQALVLREVVSLDRERVEVERAARSSFSTSTNTRSAAVARLGARSGTCTRAGAAGVAPSERAASSMLGVILASRRSSSAARRRAAARDRRTRAPRWFREQQAGLHAERGLDPTREHVVDPAEGTSTPTAMTAPGMA